MFSSKNSILRYFFLLIFVSNLSVLSKARASDIKNLKQEKCEELNNFLCNIKRVWQEPNKYDLYIPLLTWHNRLAYDKAKINRYNEKPFGLGAGWSKIDAKMHWYALYIIAFKDSFNQWEPFVGYAWESIKSPFNSEKWHVGYGITTGITMRENWHYIPVPAILPIASAGYGALNFQATYIPGVRNNGNVLFLWLRYGFKI